MHEGVSKIEDGDAWGYFSVPENYSRDFIERFAIIAYSDTMIY